MRCKMCRTEFDGEECPFCGTKTSGITVTLEGHEPIPLEDIVEKEEKEEVTKDIDAKYHQVNIPSAFSLKPIKTASANIALYKGKVGRKPKGRVITNKKELSDIFGREAVYGKENTKMFNKVPTVTIEKCNNILAYLKANGRTRRSVVEEAIGRVAFHTYVHTLADLGFITHDKLEGGKTYLDLTAMGRETEFTREHVKKRNKIKVKKTKQSKKKEEKPSGQIEIPLVTGKLQKNEIREMFLQFHRDMAELNSSKMSPVAKENAAKGIADGYVEDLIKKSA